ncbi:hypothetical protein H8356DRAFT_1069107 [Neocallimastix lanati (nom. inval.)]|nr:hypothetical protein H8356DRAFT_1069107 [Neocallimastix sp. JGI-2020a]
MNENYNDKSNGNMNHSKNGNNYNVFNNFNDATNSIKPLINNVLNPAYYTTNYPSLPSNPLLLTHPHNLILSNKKIKSVNNNKNQFLVFPKILSNSNINFNANNNYYNNYYYEDNKNHI